MSAITVRANMRMMFDDASANKAQTSYMNRLSRMEKAATASTSKANAKLVSEGTFSNVTSGDSFQLLEIPANTIVLTAGANVTTAFTGGSATADIDFAAGDDIVDGGDITSTGYLAAGSNGQANIINTGAANTFTALIETADTIDVKIAATDTACVSGVLRVYAILADISSQQKVYVIYDSKGSLL